MQSWVNNGLIKGKSLLETLNTYLQSNCLQKRLKSYALVLLGRMVPLKLCLNSGSFTDGKSITVGLSEGTWERLIDMDIVKDLNDALSILKGLTAHEAEHIYSSSFTLLETFIKQVADSYPKKYQAYMQNFAKNLMNGVEDGRIERRAAERNKGVGSFIQYMDLCLYKLSACSGNPLRDILLAIDLIATLNAMPPQWESTYDKESEVEQLIKKVYPFVLKGVETNSQERCFQHCVEVHSLLKPFILKQLEKMEADGTFTNSDPDQKNWFFNDDHEYEGNDGTDPEPEDSNPSTQKVKILLTGEQVDDLIKAATLFNRRNSKEVNADLKQIEKEAIQQSSQLTKNELYEVSARHHAVYIDRVNSSQEPLEQNLQKRSDELRKGIDKILKSKKREQQWHLRSGQLDIKSLTRCVALKEQDIFYRTERSDVDDIAFTLIIDLSGSMDASGPYAKTKLEYAIEAAAIIEAALMKVVPIKIIGFASDRTMTEIVVFKDFDTVSKGSLKYISSYTNNSGNYDGYVLDVASRELEKRKESKKCILMLSDGLPSVGTESNLTIPNVVKRVRKKGIEVIPIAFGTNSIDAYLNLYYKNVVFCQPNEIEKELIKVIAKCMRL